MTSLRPITRVCFVLSIGAAIAFGGMQGPSSSGLTPRVIATLGRQLAAERDRRQIPALSVAVVHREGRWVEAFGTADLENGVAATPASIFRLASISNPITATAALRLQEQGKLDLDADIRKYVPSFHIKPWPITPRRLLGHLGGIRGYRPGEVASTRHYVDVVTPLAIFAEDPLAHEPGTKYLYSTYGYNLLAAAVESASGRPFVETLREFVFEPAGMTATGPDDARALISNRVRGYRPGPDGKPVNCILADTSNKIPGGGLCATAADVAAFGKAFLDGKLVQDATRDSMSTPQRLNSGEKTNYGLGWNVGSHQGRREILHTGGQPGTSTILYLRPDEGIVVAILTNLEGAKLQESARSIADRIAAEAELPKSAAR
jgi:CubicO group peptidase (beta-lactamase class C family)